MRLVFIIVCSLLLSGCAGVSTVPGASLHTDGCRTFSSANGGTHINKDRFKLTSSDVEELYGKPEKIIRTETGEQWYYSNGLKWRGIIIWIVVLIPLVLPVGRDYHIVNVSNGLCISEELQLDENDHGFACGLFWGDKDGFGFLCGTK